MLNLPSLIFNWAMAFSSYVNVKTFAPVFTDPLNYVITIVFNSGYVFKTVCSVAS